MSSFLKQVFINSRFILRSTKEEKSKLITMEHPACSYRRLHELKSTGLNGIVYKGMDEGSRPTMHQ